jgi:hypothetical protein
MRLRLIALALPGVLAACGPSPTASEMASSAPTETARPTEVARVTYPSGCGTSAMIDYLYPAGGDTPAAAAHAFVESYRSSEPDDARAAADRDAILASAELLGDEGRVDGEHRFVARDSEGALAILAASWLSDAGYVVSWYWVRLPDEFCPDF